MYSKPDNSAIDDSCQNFFIPVGSKNYFEREAIADAYKRYGNIMRLHCTEWGFDMPTTEDFLDEWIYITTGQARTDGLQNCKFLTQIDELREMYALSDNLPLDATWNEILAKELDRYSGPIEIALQDGLNWSYIFTAVRENWRASQIRFHELSRDANVDDILEAARAYKAESIANLALAKEERIQGIERIRKTFELSNDMSPDEIERWFDRKLLQQRIDKALDSGLPPDDLEI